MKPEAQRIAIAEACGWTRVNPKEWYKRLLEAVPPFIFFQDSRDIPDYLNDLNAMHEAEKVLIKQQRSAGGYLDSNWTGCWTRYVNLLNNVPFYGGSIHATAAHRAEAFLRTLGLWKD